MRAYFERKMMVQLGPLWRERECLTVMNVVYKFADCSALLPDISSHPTLNFYFRFSGAAASLADQIICDIFISFAAKTAAEAR